KELEIEIKRNQETKVYKVVPLYNKEQGFSFIGFNPAIKPVLDFNILRGIKESIYKTYDLTVKYLKIIVSIFTGGIPLKMVYEQSAGPIGITKIMYDFANTGMFNYLMLVAFINVVIGLFNLLPFPALDGGRIFFILINYLLLGISLVIKRKLVIEPDKEELFHKAGLIILLIFVVFVSFNDVQRIIKGESFIK
ncbi:MAG: site-2 protease family protein, partial [bacterium]